MGTSVQERCRASRIFHKQLVSYGFAFWLQSTYTQAMSAAT